ncbi:hypothetical protein FJR11_10540 [Anabaena sp. UHCC 0187]|uniref:HEPN domain-containing protein n=1 Tax=Anabaena sp. UHCC 0187 TaxID=2590018 RepID=UPI00144724DA|nr:HEPN domain-containing protein [Anabaena sp. UHCC 0187]MTJ13020.1 hypothetical protein [Anabaena sp. UHCC 0187]
MEFKFVDQKIEKTINQTWNTLIKPKNYCIASTLEDLAKSFKTPHLTINSQIWMFNDESIKKMREFTDIFYFKTIYINKKTEEIATYDTIWKSIKIELELEISNIYQGIEKRNFQNVITAIFSRMSEQIKKIDFFFILDGLELEEINQISFGNIKIVKFDKNLTNDFYEKNIEINPLYAENLKKNIEDNFLNKVVMICSAFGDSDKAEEIVRYKSKELINYFRYIICVWTHERISENIFKINIASEAYTQTEYLLYQEVTNNTTGSIRSRGRRSLQKFIINKKLLNDLEEKAFLNEVKTFLNNEQISELEGSIITAIYWTGEAQNEFDLDIAFLKYWTALETIFSNEKEKITHALCKGISITLALSRYHFIKDCETLTIYKRISYLYDKRSKIIHTGFRKSITPSELSEICRYTSYVILSLFDFRNQGYTELKQIGREIEKHYKIVNKENTQKITALADKIQKILVEISTLNSMNTTTEKMIIAAKSIENIENNSNLMQEIMDVIRQSDITDLAKLLNHPSAPFLIVALEGLQKK